MSQSPFAPVETARHRWQFSLRGLLIFTASVAVGASVWQAKLASWTSQGTSPSFSEPSKQEFIKSGWAGGLLAVLVIWLLFGLAYQIKDLSKFLSSHRDLDPEQRFGARLEIAWRAAIVAFFAFYVLLAVLLNQGWIALPDKEDFLNIWGGGNTAREAAMLLILILIVASVPHVRRKPRWPPLKWIINLIAWCLAIEICLMYWHDQTEIAFLVHIATISIDIARPLKFSQLDSTCYVRCSSFFYHWSIVSGAIVIFNWICLRGLARQWSKGTFRRAVWSALFLSGTAAVGSFLVWLYGRGLEQLSPHFAEVGAQQAWHGWAAIIATYFILITAVAYQLATLPDPIPRPLQRSWRANAHKYYHEWRSVLFGLAAAVVAFRIYAQYEAQQLVQRHMQPGFSFPMTPVFSPRFFGEAFFFRPIDYLWLALVLISIFRALEKRADPRCPQPDVPRVNRAKFVLLWLAAAAFVITSTLALIWMSFGLWFDPAYIRR